MTTHATPSSRHGSFTLIFGVIGIICGLFFFLQGFNIIPTTFQITDQIYANFFAGFSLLAGIMLLLNSAHKM